MAQLAQPDEWFTALQRAPTSVPGFSTWEELCERCISALEEQPAAIDHPSTSNWWKTACIVEDVYYRMTRRAMGSTDRTPEPFGDRTQARRPGLVPRPAPPLPIPVGWPSESAQPIPSSAATSSRAASRASSVEPTPGRVKGENTRCSIPASAYRRTVVLVRSPTRRT